MIIKTVKLAMLRMPEDIMRYFDRNLHCADLYFEVDVLDDPEALELYDYIISYGYVCGGGNVICIDPKGDFPEDCYDVWHTDDTLAVRIDRFVELLTYKYRFSDTKKHKDALMQLAMKDALTGVYNRAYVMEQVIPENTVYNVAFFDVNFFKEVNDIMGHERGDMVLLAVVSVIRKHMPSDIVARWGGDEFIVMRVTDTTSKSDFRKEIVDLTRIINKAIKDSVSQVACSVSAGTATNRGGEDFNALIKRADESMYVMKEMIHSAAIQ